MTIPAMWTRAIRLSALVLLPLSSTITPTPAQAQWLRSAERAAVRAAERHAGERAAARTLAARAGRQAADRLVHRWTVSLCKPARPCPLPERHASSFTGGSYSEVLLGKDTRLYRVYSRPGYRLGVPGERYSYWSRSDATGSRAVIDSAIPTTRNGNRAVRRVSIVVPRGVTVYEGTARGLPRGPVGGGSQVILDGVRRNWVVKP